MTKKKGLLSGLLILIGFAVLVGVVMILQKGNFDDQGRASLGNSMSGKLVRSTDKVCTKCVEQCPGKDNILRSCSPMESDGTSVESLCNNAGRTESCGGKVYCCPSVNGKWTTDLRGCKAKTTPTVRTDPQTRRETFVENKQLMPTSIPSDYRLLREGGTCTALVVNKNIAEPYINKDVTVVGSLKEPYFFVTKISLNTKCIEQCPGKDGVLRSCTPPESDGSSNDSKCDTLGRVESCGGTSYCCPNVGGVWTKDMSRCKSAPVTPKTTTTPIPSDPSRPTTPTPYSTPTSNLAPQITTNSLATARVNSRYSFAVQSKDLNPNDRLSMSIIGLPDGLSMGACFKNMDERAYSYSCQISGIPTKAGEFQIAVSVADDKGLSTQKNLKLIVN